LTSRRRVAAALGAAAFAVYLASSVRQVSDSYYSLLVAEQLASHRSFDLAEHFAGELPLDRFPGNRQNGLPYQVERHGERILYVFPPGASLLATPWMAAARAAGYGVVGEDGRYDKQRERRHQKLLGAAFTAAFVAAAFVALDRLLARRAAIGCALALAFATPLWSTASRGLWSHTALLFVLGLALPILASRARGEAGGGARLGLLAATAYACRPTASLALALLGLFLLRTDRRAAVRFAAGAAAGLALFVALSWATWGSWLPPYYLAGRLTPPSLESAAGVLVSPSRGLAVYEPALVAALAFGVARRRRLEQAPLFGLGAAGVALHAVVVASFPHWWGGHGYGPRLFTDTLFFQALIAASVAATLASEPAGAWRRAFVALVALGVGIHAAGALSSQSNRWNWAPAEVDERPERLWEWRDPQMLAWANRAPREGATIEPPPAAPPSDPPPAMRQRRHRARDEGEARRPAKRRGRGERP
jgi:hypothetical protein